MEVAQSGSVPRRPRRLTPTDKYEVFRALLTGQATQRQAADRWKVDRSTVVHICQVATRGALDALAASVPGRPGQTLEQAAMASAQLEIERLRATVAELLVGIQLAEGKSGLGLRAGRVPARVDANMKVGLLDLVNRAVEAGWSPRRAAARLGVDDSRLARWQRRRDRGELADRAPGRALRPQP